jgi:CheY-like chemotaxis protein
MGLRPWHDFFPNGKPMHRITDIPSGLRRPLQDVIEVRLWEIYLLHNRKNLYETLCTYSLDKGPLATDLSESKQLSFRFMLFDWARTIELMLAIHSIPYQVVHKTKVDVIRQVNKKKVYVAEDELDILFALNIMLENAGYDVLLSHCGNPIMQENLPATDLFILDKRMPDVDGIQVCRHLKSNPATKHVPVIMISAAPNFKEQALKAGVNDCLEKPFQMPDLLKLVSKYTQPVLSTAR